MRVRHSNLTGYFFYSAPPVIFPLTPLRIYAIIRDKKEVSFHGSLTRLSSALNTKKVYIMYEYRLSDLLDRGHVQKLADANYRASGLPMTILDVSDNTIFVRAGWPGMCNQYHRADPRSAARCVESDNYVVDRIPEGESLQYKCNNGLWHIATPITAGGRHRGTLFLTQFFFDDEQIDRDFFVRQADEFGFDVNGYLDALARLPVFSREKVDYILAYYQAMARFMSDLAEKSIQKAAAEALEKAHAELADSNALLRAEIEKRRSVEAELRILSESDSLTGAYNRRKFFELLANETSKVRRFVRPLSIIMFDLDHFKRVNDQSGHAVGDLVLKAVAAVMGNAIREVDIFARYGGEEFVVCCPETTAGGAVALAEKIRRLVNEYAFPVIGKLTVSAGVAELVNAEETELVLLKRADEALYRAKNLGRNRVETAA
jgi:diguanylate cyclase (GGDEF)-like protein